MVEFLEQFDVASQLRQAFAGYILDANKERKTMKTVLFAWFLSMFVCSIYTFILPAWDSFMLRRANRGLPSSNRGEPVSNVVGSRRRAV